MPTIAAHPTIAGPAEPPPIPAPPPAPVAPLLTHARTSFAKLAVRGSLPDGEIRRPLDRATPDLRQRYTRAAFAAKKSPAAVVHLAFTVEDTRAVANPRASSDWPALAACAQSVIGELRTNVAPDVGTVAVTVDLAYQPESP